MDHKVALDRLLKDFKSLEHLSVFTFFLRKVPKGISNRATHLCKFIKSVTGFEYDEQHLRLVMDKVEYMLPRLGDRSMEFSDDVLCQKLVEYSEKQDYALGQRIANNFMPFTSHCCGITFKVKPYHTSTVYQHGDKIHEGTQYYGVCEVCKIKYYMCHYERDGKTYYPDYTKLDYISFTPQTVFEKKLLVSLDLDM